MKNWHRNLILGGLLSLVSLQTFPVSPPDTERGRALSVGCLSCHGEKGEGHGSIPSINTLDPETFRSRFQNFKEASPSNSVMHRISLGYSDEEIRLMAQTLAKGARP